MSNLQSKLTVSLKDDVTGPAKTAAASLKNIGASAKELEHLGKIDAFRATQKSFADARAAFNAAQASVRKVAQEMAAADAPTRKLQASYTAAQRAAKAAATAFQQQSASIKESMASLNGAGIPLSRLAAQENNLRAAIERRGAASVAATAAMKKNTVAVRNEKALDKIGSGLKAVAAPVAAVAAYKAKEIGKKAVISAAEFDIGTRKQREFVDIPKETQDRVLIPQAKKIGQDTQFSNLDVVKAQTKAMQGLPSSFDADTRADVGAAIVETVKNYALTMEADLEGSSEAIRTFLQTTNKDISTKEKAVYEATRATNLMVKMAKLGGMNDEDVQQFMKFGAGTATAAGLSDTTLAAIGATGRKGGLRGDELGVFMRAMSSKLVAPTSKGLDALTVAGIDYNKFTTMPGGLSTENLAALSKRRFGKGINEDQRSRLNDILENSEVVSNREEFTKQVSDILAEGFTKKKNGETKAQDSQKIAKMVGDFHKLSTESVDAEGLLNAIMTNPKMTIALLNAFLTEKHGGKGSILGKKWPDFQAGKDELDHVGNDPDFAKRKADEIMGGLGGELERTKGSVENFELALGVATEAVSRFALKAAGDTLDKASNLPEKVLGYGAGIVAGGGALASGLITQSMLARLGVVNPATGAGAAAGGMAIGAAVGFALSDISKDFIKANPDFAAALTSNPMLGAMDPDAALASGILHPISTPGRYSKNGNRSRSGSTEREGAWIPGHGPDVFTTGATAYDKGPPPAATKSSKADDDTFKVGTKSVDHAAATIAHPTVSKREPAARAAPSPAQKIEIDTNSLDRSSEAATAAQKTGEAYKGAIPDLTDTWTKNAISVAGLDRSVEAAEAARKTADAYKAAVPDMGDVWSKSTTGVQGLNKAAEAAAAGSATGEAYKSSVATALAGVDAIYAAAVARWNGILSGVNSSPSITPKFGPAPSVGKGAALDASASKHAAFSDGNGANFGTT